MNPDKDEHWRGKVGRLTKDEMVSFLNEGQLGRLGVLDDDGLALRGPGVVRIQRRGLLHHSARPLTLGRIHPTQ